MAKDYYGRCWDYKLYDFKSKEYNLSKYIRQMMTRTSRIFKYKNLPSTIPANILEYYLQMNGTACITEYNDNLYVFFGGWGGTPDAYYRPTTYTIANPALKLNRTVLLGIDGVLCYNDSRYEGLRTMFERYATMLVENDLSMYMADIQARVQSLMTAGDDRTKQSAEKYLEKLQAGDLGVIGDNAVLESFKTVPYTSTAHNSITDLIELQQYIKASWYNEIGLNANYNMKREAINSSEAQLGEDSLRPLIDDMLESRKEWLAEVNKMYDTNIEVELASSWELKEVQDEQVESIEGTTSSETIDPESNESTTDTRDSEDQGRDSEPVEQEPEEGTEGEENKEDKDLKGDEVDPSESKIIEVPVTGDEVEKAGGEQDVD